MSLDAKMHAYYQIANTPVRGFPFPHVYVPDIFPDGFYAALRANLPPDAAYKTLYALKRVSASYSDKRFAVPLILENIQALAEPARHFWFELADWLLGNGFARLLLAKFGPTLEQRFTNNKPSLYAEAFIVRDSTAYSLGPHTDSASKVLSVLFYLPADDSLAQLGTTLYLPKDRAFKCAGGPHHEFDKFDPVAAMPYRPNVMFAFPRTDNSFHGVKPIQKFGVRRDILQYDIKVAAEPIDAQAVPAPIANPASKFSF